MSKVKGTDTFKKVFSSLISAATAFALVAIVLELTFDIPINIGQISLLNFVYKSSKGNNCSQSKPKTIKLEDHDSDILNSEGMKNQSLSVQKLKIYPIFESNVQNELSHITISSAQEHLKSASLAKIPSSHRHGKLEILIKFKKEYGNSFSLVVSTKLNNKPLAYFNDITNGRSTENAFTFLVNNACKALLKLIEF